METIQKERIPQMTFEFREWKEMFRAWKENAEVFGEENMQLVMSTDHYTSGYWIENKGTDLTKGDILYTGKKVHDLEKRLIKEHELAKKEERGVRFVR